MPTREMNMTTRNLLTALAAALAANPLIASSPAPGPNITTPPDNDFLLNALRNSATGRDQIMQRRIGILPDTPAS